MHASKCERQDACTLPDVDRRNDPPSGGNRLAPAWRRAENDGGAINRAGRALAIIVLAAALAGCSSGGSGTPPTSTAPATSALPTSTPDDAAEATTAAGSLAARLSPVLVDAGDYPPELTGKHAQTKLLAASDVPGLSAPASGFFATVASADGNEFVNVIAIVPDDRNDVPSLLAAFEPKEYLPGLTSGARDAASAPLSLSASPSGATGFSYTGSVPAQGKPRPIQGEAVGFTHGAVFVLLIHGAYTAPTRDIQLDRLAAAVDRRLAGVQEAD